MEKAVKKTVKEEKKKMELNPKIWEVPYNADLVAQVIYVYNSNERKGTATVKSRGDVSGGGKKPWKQKGTGRARHGSSRSPIWVGGGVAFASNDRNYSRKINKKVAKKALCIMLSQRLRDKELEFSSFAKEIEGKAIRENVGKKMGKKMLLISESENLKKYLNNMVGVDVVNPLKLNAKHIAGSKNILIDEDSVKVIEERLTDGE